MLYYFKWLTEELKEKGMSADRVIIYCQTVKQCHTLYSMLLDEIGDIVYPDSESRNERLIEMLHSTMPVRVKHNIIKSMTIYNGTVRCLLCTIAFGMGMDCKGVTTVVNFGPSKNIEACIQESGRCGRGGEKAVILFYGRMLKNVSKEMKNFVRLPDGACRRKYLLQFFDLNQEEMLMAQTFSHKHECCDLCAKLCTCVAGGCDAMNDLLVSNVPVTCINFKENCLARTTRTTKEQADCTQKRTCASNI